LQVNKTTAAIRNISYLEPKVHFQENIKCGAIEVSQLLEVLTALTEERESVHSTTSSNSQVLVTPVPRDKVL
ncbi:hypothetical protein ACQP3D_28620, partial [Escherichia coli]